MKKQPEANGIWRSLLKASPVVFCMGPIAFPMKPVSILGFTAYASSLVMWLGILMFFIGTGLGVAATLAARKAAAARANEEKQKAVPAA